MIITQSAEKEDALKDRVGFLSGKLKDAESLCEEQAREKVQLLRQIETLEGKLSKW